VESYLLQILIPLQVLELLHEFGSMEKNFPSLLERQIQSFEQLWHFPTK
jgi:hypothetical protein